VAVDVPRRWLWCAGSCPAFVGRRATPRAARRGTGARAPWNKWKGPAWAAAPAKAGAGRQPFMPRKALVPGRATLRFARMAADEDGATRPADAGLGRARECAAVSSRPRGAQIRDPRPAAAPRLGRHALPWDASKRLEKPWAGHAQSGRVQLELSTDAGHNLSTGCGSIGGPAGHCRPA
jgi:hypothetical protein